MRVKSLSGGGTPLLKADEGTMNMLKFEFQRYSEEIEDK